MESLLLLVCVAIIAIVVYRAFAKTNSSQVAESISTNLSTRIKGNTLDIKLDINERIQDVDDVAKSLATVDKLLKDV